MYAAGHGIGLCWPRVPAVKTVVSTILKVGCAEPVTLLFLHVYRPLTSSVIDRFRYSIGQVDEGTAD